MGTYSEIEVREVMEELKQIVSELTPDVSEVISTFIRNNHFRNGVISGSEWLCEIRFRLPRNPHDSGAGKKTKGL